MKKILNKMPDWLLYCICLLIPFIIISSIKTICEYREKLNTMEEVTEEVTSIETEVESVEETQPIIIDSSPLPESYILMVDAGTGTIKYEVEAESITYNTDGSYVVETSLGNELIFKDGACVIHRYNDLIEIFTEYSFILKENVYTVLDREEITNE